MIPLDLQSLCECKFDVSTIQLSDSDKSSTPFVFNANQVVEVEVEVNDLTRDSTNNPNHVSYLDNELTIMFSDWGLIPGNRYPVTIRLKLNGESRPRLMVGAFTYTRIVLIPQ